MNYRCKGCVDYGRSIIDGASCVFCCRNFGPGSSLRYSDLYRAKPKKPYWLLFALVPWALIFSLLGVFCGGCTYRPKPLTYTEGVYKDAAVRPAGYPVCLDVSALPEETRDAVSRAASVWNSTLGRAAFIVGPSGTCQTWVAFEVVPYLFDDDVDRLKGKYTKHRSAKFAIEKVQGPLYPGAYTEAKVQVAANTTHDRVWDQRNRMAHELGHALGLDHSPFSEDLMSQDLKVSFGWRTVTPEELELIGD